MNYNPISAEALVEHLGSVAEATKVALEGETNTAIQSAARLDEAKRGDLSFFGSEEFAHAFANTNASVVIGPFACPYPKQLPTLIRSSQPSLAFAQALTHLAQPIPPPAGIHPRAVVEASAVIDPTASIAPFAYIGHHTTIGAGSVIHPSAVIMHSCTIGQHCLIYPHVTIREECMLGDRVILQAGVVIGADGYGYIPTSTHAFKVPQVGGVSLADDVEVGSLSNVDRAALGKTRIGKGSKLDSLVHIAHNCTLGQHVAIMGNTTLAGGVEIEDGAIIYGSSNIINRIHIGKGSTVQATALVVKNVAAGQRVAGNPARPRTAHLRQQAASHQTPQAIQHLTKRLEALEKRLLQQANQTP